MQLKTFYYHAPEGWSVKSFPNLDSQQTLVIVFGASNYLKEPEPIKELIQAFPHSQVVGCSSAGEIFGEIINDDSLSVAVLKFDQSKIAVTTEAIRQENSFDVGKKLAKKLLKDDLKAIFILSVGLNVNGTDLINGFNEILPKDIIITGGLAGDGDQFKKTWILSEGTLKHDSVVAVGLYGQKLKISHGSRGGWDIFGPERVITRSKDNILYEIDHKPALSLYKNYLGERASGLPATALLFPLAIRKNMNDAAQIVRTILSINEEDQSMTFAGTIPQGWCAQLMKANFDRLIEGASGASIESSKSIKKIKDEPILAIAISCVGRRLVLGERTEEEVEATLENLPKQSQQIGFYSYGEISPTGLGRCDLHNQTMTLTTISELN